MNNIYTIGFTKKSAQAFFGLLESNEIEVVLDVRLKNTSQLAGFSRYPDIKYFLEKIIGAEYISDTLFAPTEEILNRYKKKIISWNDYVYNYNRLMDDREIEEYILKKYQMAKEKKMCLLCSEEKADYCHRQLVADKFKILLNMEIINL